MSLMQLIETSDERLESVCPRCVWAEDLDAALARYHGCVAARLDFSHPFRFQPRAHRRGLTKEPP